MKLNNVSFPHPVLSCYTDDILPMLEENSIACKVSKQRDEYVFEITLSLNNKDILDLIRSDAAVYACEIDCQKTFYRKCETSKKGHFKFSIPRGSVRGPIVFTCLVIAVREINDYSNKGFNPDYDNQKFSLEAGDLLAAFPQQRYDVDIKYDELKTAGAFMQIRKDETGNPYTWFDISGDKIDIVLPEALYDWYRKNIGNEIVFSAIIHSSIVFNALVYALFNINENSECKWARAIATRLDIEKDKFDGLDIETSEDILKITQILLDDPYKRLFDNIKQIKEQNEEEE